VIGLDGIIQLNFIILNLMGQRKELQDIQVFEISRGKVFKE
jgi:hypothetical protein